MSDRLKNFFNEELLPAEGADEYTRALGIQYATAALLIEVAKADDNQDDLERAVINATLQDTFDLSDEMLDQLLEIANEAAPGDDDLLQITALVNEHYEDADKIKLVEYLWMVAFADGRLDRYEEQFIAKVAQLLQLSDEALEAAKNAAQDR